MILKPSEIAPFNAMIFAEILHDAGVPAGVFNLVNGDGPGVGESMSRHPGIDMMSFTGPPAPAFSSPRVPPTPSSASPRNWAERAPTSFSPDCGPEDAVTRGVRKCFSNTGQSCNAPTRMGRGSGRWRRRPTRKGCSGALPRSAPPASTAKHIGPVVSELQFNKIQDLIESGIKEGADLVAGGLGRPDGHEPRLLREAHGVCQRHAADAHRPRGNLRSGASIMAYDTIDDAVREANDTVYGLASYVQSKDLARRATWPAGCDRAASTSLSGLGRGPALRRLQAIGNGREYAEFGLEDFLEVKGIGGYEAA